MSVRRTTPEAVGDLKSLGSADTFFRWAKGFKPFSLAAQLSCILTDFALRVAGPVLVSGVTLALDIVKIPYYGRLTSSFFTGGKAERGTAYFSQYLTVSVVLCGFRFPLAFRPLQRGDRRHLATWLTAYYHQLRPRFPILLIILDRGFGSNSCVRALKRLDCSYVVALANNTRLKRIARDLGLLTGHYTPHAPLGRWDGQLDQLDPSGAVLTDYRFGKPRVQTRLVLYRYQIRYRRGRRRGQRVTRTAAFATNLAAAPSDIRALYARRWSIETGYRGINQFRGWTRCRWASVRVWLYGMAMLLHAAWLATNLDAIQPPISGHHLQISPTHHRWIKQRTLAQAIDAHLPQIPPINIPESSEVIALACE